MLAGLVATLAVTATLVALTDAADAGSCGVIRGTSADDRLTGCRHADRIAGGKGSDVLDGRGGRDRLRGGRHRDRLRGGPGRDRIRARDGTRDRVDCGRGRDTARVDSRDRVRGCERVNTGRDACSPAPDQLSSEDCRIIFRDSSTVGSARRVWHDLACADDSRVQHEEGGDPQRAASEPVDSFFRRVTVLDGDDSSGERCELGKNSRTTGPTALYRPDTRRITFISVKLGSSMDLSQSRWQAVIQMKQTAPADGQSGTPALELDAFSNRWHLRQSGSLFGSSTGRGLWSAPAQKGVWTRFAFDITYSPHPSKGRIKIYADLNGDGDATDAGEQSPLIETATLKRETAGTTADGLAEGEPIPSHLRAGIYHDPNYVCPPPDGCEVGIDNVRVAAVGR